MSTTTTKTQKLIKALKGSRRGLTAQNLLDKTGFVSLASLTSAISRLELNEHRYIRRIGTPGKYKYTMAA